MKTRAWEPGPPPAISNLRGVLFHMKAGFRFAVFLSLLSLPAGTLANGGSNLTQLGSSFRKGSPPTDMAREMMESGFSAIADSIRDQTANGGGNSGNGTENGSGPNGATPETPSTVSGGDPKPRDMDVAP